MLAPLMKHLLLASACSIVVGVLVLAGLVALDAPLWTRVLALVAMLAAPDLYCRLVVPRGARKRLLKAVDPTAGPPLGATPADSPLIDHLDMLSEVKDYDALRSLLSDDFEVVAGRLRYGAPTYIRSLKAGDRQLPGKRKTDEIGRASKRAECHLGPLDPISQAALRAGVCLDIVDAGHGHRGREPRPRDHQRRRSACRVTINAAEGRTSAAALEAV
jgi:hypothetical protein